MAAARSGLKVCGLPMERRGAARRQAVERRPGGRTVQVHVRAAVRTNQARADKSGNSWGHAASRKIHSRAERWREPRSRPVRCDAGPRPYVVCESGRREPVRWSLAKVSAYGCSMRGLRGLSCGRRGRGVSPSRSARLYGDEGTGIAGMPWGRTRTRGDDARLWVSRCRRAV